MEQNTAAENDLLCPQCGNWQFIINGKMACLSVAQIAQNVIIRVTLTFKCGVLLEG